MSNPHPGSPQYDYQAIQMILIQLENLCAVGSPGWLSGLASPSAQSVIPETWDRVPRQAPCMEPASPSDSLSLSFSLSLSLSVCVCVS